VTDLTLMVMPDRKVWIDCECLVSYLRMIQRQADAHGCSASDSGDTHSYAAAMGVSGMLQQIADSLDVTALSALERMEKPRVP